MIFIYDDISYAECKCKNKIEGFIEKRKKLENYYWFYNNNFIFLKIKIPLSLYRKILEDYKKNDEFEFKLLRNLNDQLPIFEEENIKYYKVKSSIIRSTICSSYNNDFISVNFELFISWHKGFDKVETREFILKKLLKNEKQE